MGLNVAMMFIYNFYVCFVHVLKMIGQNIFTISYLIHKDTFAGI